MKFPAILQPSHDSVSRYRGPVEAIGPEVSVEAIRVEAEAAVETIL